MNQLLKKSSWMSMAYPKKWLGSYMLLPVGKAWKQMRSPPPSTITAEVWEEAKGKLKPHADVTPPPADAKSWRPTVEQCITVIYELKHNKAPDVGGWSTESAKAVFLLPHLPALWTAWLTRIAHLHPEACQARTWHAHKLVCFKKPAGGHRPILISSVWIRLIVGSSSRRREPP